MSQAVARAPSLLFLPFSFSSTAPLPPPSSSLDAMVPPRPGSERRTPAGRRGSLRGGAEAALTAGPRAVSHPICLPRGPLPAASCSHGAARSSHLAGARRGTPDPPGAGRAAAPGRGGRSLAAALTGVPGRAGPPASHAAPGRHAAVPSRAEEAPGGSAPRRKPRW